MAQLIDERITDEIEALEAILLDDVVIHRSDGIPNSIETVVHPSTGDDINQQYVCVTLEVKITPKYPDESPIVKLRNPRGLDDALIDHLKMQVKDKISECLGQPVVFELIELIRENLTESNLPTGQCVICLYGFSPGDIFIKTQCYHYFHSHCLGSHLVAAEKNYKEELDNMPLWQKQQAEAYKATCPVCRSGIECRSEEMESLTRAPAPRASLAAPPFRLTAEMRLLQAKMSALLAHQAANGGTTDTVPSGPPAISLTTTRTEEALPVGPPPSVGVLGAGRGAFRGLRRRGRPGRRPAARGAS